MGKEEKSNDPWLTVPEFGEWDKKDGMMPTDYSMDFSKIREMRKQNRRDATRASLGNEEDFVPNSTSSTTTTTTTTTTTIPNAHHHHINSSPPGKKSIFSYFNCCVKA